MRMDFATIVLLYVTLLISLVFHEAAHATVAMLGGDRTAYVGGQVTLNPIPHIQREPMGTVVLPLLMLIASNGTMCFGFAHAPYDPLWAHRHPKRAALMSAAGPMANILLALVAFAVLKGLVMSDMAVTVTRMSPTMMLDPADGAGGGLVFGIIRIASAFLLLNVLLAMINLVPLPPFDGAGIVEGLAPRTAAFYDMARSQLAFVIMGLVAVWWFIGEYFFPVMAWITDWL